MKILGYEFTIKKISKRKKTTGFNAKKWTTSEKNTVLRLSNEGMPITQIAKDMHRTVPAINSMLYKLHKGKK